MNHVVVIMFILYLANKRSILSICSNFNPKSVTTFGEIENFINDRQQKDIMYVRCTTIDQNFPIWSTYIYIQNLKNMKKVMEFCVRIYKFIHTTVIRKFAIWYFPKDLEFSQFSKRIYNLYIYIGKFRKFPREYSWKLAENKRIEILNRTSFVNQTERYGECIECVHRPQVLEQMRNEFDGTGGSLMSIGFSILFHILKLYIFEIYILNRNFESTPRGRCFEKF